MNLIVLALLYARYRYITYRVFLRLRMGKSIRDDYLRRKKLRIFDFLPEIAYEASGIKVVLRKGTHDYYMFFKGEGNQNWKTEQYVREQLKMSNEEVFVDVGANVGGYSLRIAHDYANLGVRVIAIEAEPNAYRALVRNININKMTNIHAIQVAASDHKGSATLRAASYDGVRVGTGLHTIMQDVVKGSFSLGDEYSLQIDCNTLDNIISNHRVDVMKMDIQGAEVLALRGAARTLKKLRKIIVEIHGENLDSVKEVLESTGFRLEIGPAAQYVTGTR